MSTTAPCILAFDTSTTFCSVALIVGSQTMVRDIEATANQTAVLLPIIAELLGEASIKLSELDCIVYGQGPGSFTGIRIAASVAQGLSLPLSIPLLPVSSMEVTAQAIFMLTGIPQIIVALDAKMNEVYWGFYHQKSEELLSLIGSETKFNVAQIVVQDELDQALPFAVVGDAWVAYNSQLRASFLPSASPSTFSIARLSRALAMVAMHHFQAGAHLGLDASTQLSYMAFSTKR